MNEPTIESLRRAGAQRLDPPRFKYLETLSQRLQAQPDSVRRLLQDKLQAAIAEYAQRFADAPPALVGKKLQLVASSPAPLALLNAHIRSQASARSEPGTAGEPAPADELASVRRFRSAWQQTRTEDQVLQAVARKPANAGPLNSHVLVLQSLAMLQDLSPAYLRRFVTQLESLQWLEEAAAQYPQPQARQAPRKAKPARSARLKK